LAIALGRGRDTTAVCCAAAIHARACGARTAALTNVAGLATRASATSLATPAARSGRAGGALAGGVATAIGTRRWSTDARSRFALLPDITRFAADPGDTARSEGLTRDAMFIAVAAAVCAAGFVASLALPWLTAARRRISAARRGISAARRGVSAADVACVPGGGAERAAFAGCPSVSSAADRHGTGTAARARRPAAKPVF
jgi:hypothetical protein